MQIHYGAIVLYENSRNTFIPAATTGAGVAITEATVPGGPIGIRRRAKRTKKVSQTIMI